jgi:hypothetical protein
MLSHLPASSTSDAVKPWIPKALFAEPLAVELANLPIDDIAAADVVLVEGDAAFPT